MAHTYGTSIIFCFRLNLISIKYKHANFELYKRLQIKKIKSFLLKKLKKFEFANLKWKIIMGQF